MKFVFPLIILLIFTATNGFAVEEKFMVFDNNLSIKIVGQVIPDSDVIRSLRYAKNLYSEKKYDKSIKLLNMISDNYTGAHIPEINFYKSKNIFMKGDYLSFFESYKKNYLLFEDEGFLKTDKFKITLRKAIEKMCDLEISDPSKDYQNLKVILKSYALYTEISNDKSIQLKNKIENRLGKIHLTKLNVNLPTRWSCSDDIKYPARKVANMRGDTSNFNIKRFDSYYEKINAPVIKILQSMSIREAYRYINGIAKYKVNTKEEHINDIIPVVWNDSYNEKKYEKDFFGRKQPAGYRSVDKYRKFEILYDYKTKVPTETVLDPSSKVLSINGGKIHIDKYHEFSEVTTNSYNMLCISSSGNIVDFTLELNPLRDFLLNEFGNVYEWAAIGGNKDGLL